VAGQYAQEIVISDNLTRVDQASMPTAIKELLVRSGNKAWYPGLSYQVSNVCLIGNSRTTCLPGNAAHSR